jgi:hypothetical protein
MTTDTKIKNAHILSFIFGASIAARIFGIRTHWVRSARETGHVWF